MLEELKALKPFASLDRAALATVERHASWLRLPPQRWLLRRGQTLSREMFLVDGTVAAQRDGGIERLNASATDGLSLNVRAADADEIITATTVQLIAVDLRPIRALLQGASAAPPAVAGVSDWMQTLLRGPVMRWFSPSAWARVLRAGRIRQVRQGERIVRRGEVCSQVFVVTEGVALRDGERLGVGQFFGEESALGRLPSRHEVVMASDGALACFQRADLVELAADYDPPRLNPPPRRIDLDAIPTEVEEAAFDALDLDAAIAVRCSDPARRLMVATRLMRRGYRVV